MQTSVQADFWHWPRRHETARLMSVFDDVFSFGDETTSTTGSLTLQSRHGRKLFAAVPLPEAQRWTQAVRHSRDGCLAKHIQLEIDWNAKQPPTLVAPQSIEHQPVPTAPAQEFSEQENDEEECSAEHRHDDWEALSMPVPTPLPEAVGRAVFGVDEQGNVNPNPEEVREITEHHADRLTEILDRMQDIENRIKRASGPSREALHREKERVHSAYQGTLALYAEDFGEEASRHLDAWARHQHDSESDGEGYHAGRTRTHQYDPGHPWHYYRDGDGAEPMDADAIEPASDVGSSFVGKLPKNAAKRDAKLQALLNGHRQQLEKDKTRYRYLCEQGPIAVSQHEHAIARDENVELTWASAVALKYNQIRNCLARIIVLESRASGRSADRLGPPVVP